MNDDFNPFDLSPLPKIAETPKEEETVEAKAVVKRVSLGPLFHSRFLSYLAFGGAIVLFGLIGYIGMNYYLNQKAAKDVTITQKVTPTKTSSSAGSSVNSATDKSPTATPTSGTPTSTIPAKSSTPATTPEAKVYCGVSGMPEGVCTAITSIEKNGLKNNPYVTANTSQLPNDTVIDIDQNSWFQGGVELGSVSFTAKVSGQTYNGNGYFQVENNTWKVISYKLNQ